MTACAYLNGVCLSDAAVANTDKLGHLTGLTVVDTDCIVSHKTAG